ncbi:hypothetical protein [Paraburkholderia sp.]|uniref:hypothetical protein n=1 Tax=Paraburkholderia sp. TaxID=1926495 RepID=UPI003D6DBF7E
MSDNHGHTDEQLREDIKQLLEGHMSLATLARHMAYDSVNRPKRALTVQEDCIYYSTFRQFIRQAKSAIRSGVITVREPYMMMPVEARHLRAWLDTDETLRQIEDMVDTRLVFAVDEARAWLASIGARVPGVLAVSALRRQSSQPSPSGSGASPSAQKAGQQNSDAEVRNTPAAAGHDRPARPERLARWREAIVMNWHGIVARHGASVSTHAIMRYLKAHDVTGYILPGGTPDELWWKTESGAQRAASRKTLANAVSQLRAQGFLTQ